MTTLKILTVNKNAQPLITSILNSPMMGKWSLTGFMGTIISGFAIPLEADSGIVAIVSGVSVVAFSLYQKYQDERRKREKHELLMKMLDKYVNEEDADVEVLVKLLKE